MLDTGHPRTLHVLSAAAIQDQVRAGLLAWCENASAGPAVRDALLRRLLPELDALNREHFDASPRISRTLEAFGALVQQGDAEVAWQGFVRLLDAPGENFGTWAI